MSKRPTIIDVAKAAGVSKSTVSLVLQNSQTVREDTRQSVRRAMADLGYVYNRSAAQMRSGKTGMIGLVINDLLNPFFAEFAVSLQAELAHRGFAAVIGNTDENPQMQDQVVGSMIEHGVSALIICPVYGGGFDRLIQSGIPTLQMLRKIDAQHDPFPFIAPDYEHGSRLATQHFIDRGANRIAFVGGVDEHSVTQERQAGYLHMMQQAGQDPLIFSGRATRAFGRDVVGELLTQGVDAALCFNDMVSLGLLFGCQERDITVGPQFRIIGFDDIEAVGVTHPTLSSVHCDIAGIGAGAADHVMRWLQNGTPPPAQTRTPVSLVVRQSSG